MEIEGVVEKPSCHLYSYMGILRLSRSCFMLNEACTSHCYPYHSHGWLPQSMTYVVTELYVVIVPELILRMLICLSIIFH